MKVDEVYIIGHHDRHQTTNFTDEHLNGWTFVNSGLKVKASAGVGIALAPNVKLEDVENILDGRILLIRIILHGIKLSAICAYAPTEEYAESTKQTFFSTLRKAVNPVNTVNPTWHGLFQETPGMGGGRGGPTLFSLGEGCMWYTKSGHIMVYTGK